VNLNQMRTRVRSLAGIRSEALLPQSEIDEAVNEFNYNLMSSYDWPQLVGRLEVTCTPGSATISFPAAASAVLSLHHRDAGVGHAETLRGISQAEMDRLSPGAVGKPELYVADPVQGTISFYPRPTDSHTLVLTFRRRVTPLTADTDTPLFDEEFHLMYAQAAASAVLRAHGGDSSRVQNLEQRVIASLSRARKRYLMNPDRSALPFPDRWM